MINSISLLRRNAGCRTRNSSRHWLEVHAAARSTRAGTERYGSVAYCRRATRPTFRRRMSKSMSLPKPGTTRPP